MDRIGTVNIDDDDEDNDDAPLEITTKTSKVQKTKKKRKPSKQKLKYTLGAGDEGSLETRNVDEETALTHLVFGDDDEYLDELTSVAKPRRKVQFISFGRSDGAAKKAFVGCRKEGGRHDRRTEETSVARWRGSHGRAVSEVIASAGRWTHSDSSFGHSASVNPTSIRSILASVAKSPLANTKRNSNSSRTSIPCCFWRAGSSCCCCCSQVRACHGSTVMGRETAKEKERRR